MRDTFIPSDACARSARDQILNRVADENDASARREIPAYSLDEENAEGVSTNVQASDFDVQAITPPRMS
jgi:hypothetical protein